MSETNGQCIKIKCDCCGMETLAEIRGDKIIILDKRHGKRHIAVLTIREILDKMKHLIPISPGKQGDDDRLLITD